MNEHVQVREGYSYFLVNIDCMPGSDHFNIVMDLHGSIEELLPYVASCLPGCTYVHGTRVVNLMQDGHILAVHSERVTITDVAGREEAERLCADFYSFLLDVEDRKEKLTPVLERRATVTVLEIFRSLPHTNCGSCGYPTCMAFAAGVFQRSTVLASCAPIRQDLDRHRDLILKLQSNGYETP